MTTSEYKKIRVRIMDEIKRRGLTHQQIADLIGVARPSVSRWISGRCRMREDTIDKMFKAFRL